MANVLNNAPSMLVFSIAKVDGTPVHQGVLMPKTFSSGKVGYYWGGRAGETLLITRADDPSDDPLPVTFQAQCQLVGIATDKAVDELR